MLKNITSTNLKKNTLNDSLTSFYKLKTVVENNPWHDNQSVLDHTVEVLSCWEKVLEKKEKQLELIPFGEYFSITVEEYTLDEIMRVMILFHDLGKKTVLESFQPNRANATHEFMSSVEWQQYLQIFDFKHTVTKTITDLILQHGITHQLISLHIFYGYSVDDVTREASKLFGTYTLAMMLFCYCDVKGSDLKTLNPDEYEKRIETLTAVLKLISKKS